MVSTMESPQGSKTVDSPAINEPTIRIPTRGVSMRPNVRRPSADSRLARLGDQIDRDTGPHAVVQSFLNPGYYVSSAPGLEKAAPPVLHPELLPDKSTVNARSAELPSRYPRLRCIAAGKDRWSGIVGGLPDGTLSPSMHPELQVSLVEKWVNAERVRRNDRLQFSVGGTEIVPMGHFAWTPMDDDPRVVGGEGVHESLYPHDIGDRSLATLDYPGTDSGLAAKRPCGRSGSGGVRRDERGGDYRACH
jgi:hypothetical protein